MHYREIFEAPRTTLPLSKDVLPNARDRFGALIAVMAPMDFLRLTTKHQKEIDIISSHPFTSVDSYDKGAEHGPHGEPFNKTQYNMPHLTVLYPSGRVINHEGRHRAAMIMKAGGTSFPVMLYFRSEYRYVLHYQETNYETEPEQSADMTETFTDIDALRARHEELLTLNKNLDQPFSYSYFRSETLGGLRLRGNPERPDKDERYQRSANTWLPTDIPAEFIGQFDPTIRVPTVQMKVGRLKPKY